MPGKTQGDRLDRRVALGDERGEDGEHDDRGGRDDARGSGEAAAHRVDGALAGGSGDLAVDVVLPHTRHEEHLVVHREPEQHAHQDDRHEADDRPDVRDVEEVGEPAPLEDGADDAKAAATESR